MMDLNGKNVLHGNKAKINPSKHVTPRFSNYIINDFAERDNVLVNRLDDHAEFCKKEVDDNKK